MTRRQKQFPRVLVVLACLCLLSPDRSIIVAQTKPASRGPVIATAKRDLRLSGGFIQYWSDMMEWEWAGPRRTFSYAVSG